MDKLNSIIFIQLRYKFIFKLRKKVVDYYEDINNHIKKIMNRNENSFQLKLISNYIYNSVNNELYKLIEKNNIIMDDSPIKNIIILDKIKIELRNIIQKVGTELFNDIIYFYYSESNLKGHELLEKIYILNKYFTPTKVCLYNKKTKVHEYDNNILKSNKTLLFSKIKKKNITLFEHINGAIIYVKYNKDILIITGYFNKDPLNIIRNINFLNKKYNKLLENIESLNIDKNFKYNYLEQISLRDLFILSVDDIIDKIHNEYLKIINYKKNNISYIVKDFLNKNIKEQYDVIVLFLLIENNEIQYMAYLLYDLINNESYLLKSQPLSEQIFNNLHWSLQKNFKSNITKIEDHNKNINFKVEEIPYEKRIHLMNCDDSIKQKAIDKYKEIVNKTNDNASKSQQYLDSILQIPFNIYKKEDILILKDKYELKIINIISSVNQYIRDNKIEFNEFNETKKMLYSEMVDCINKLIEFNNLNNNIIELFIKKNKNTELKSIVDSINNSQNVIQYKSKGNKKEYLEIFHEFFNNNGINSKIKSKYYNIINIQSNPINNKINNIINEWSIFKHDRKEYIENIDTILNKAIYSQNDAKKEIKRIIGQWINGKMTGYCLGFEGPPGIGKTSLAKQGIGNCLIDDKGNSRPFAFIAIGGSSNGSLLEGHNYTYVGSNYGKIIEILIQTQCMNPIIYIDELDKISNTENGKEIVGILTHLTDSAQNEHFNDKYFSGINFDLSKVLFIFSYNDYSKIDPILADRIHRIKFNYLQTQEKIHIMKHYIIPELLENIGYSKDSINFSDEIIEYIITKYTYEAGVRKLKEKVYEIIREINLEEIMDNSNKTNINISLDFVKKIFANKPQHYHKKIYSENLVGIVNGLYATSLGLGGIIEIQVVNTYSDTKMAITITGQQGDVMKESIQCAKTIAWNILPDEITTKIKESKLFGGLHLHCPEAATPKDGPSAGGAITLAIISLLINVKVKQTIALTGEIDLKGNITKIGGLDLKIEGGKAAGLKTILIPEENRIDYDIIKLEKPIILENIEIIFIKNINQILNIALEENDYNLRDLT
jgi:ATP-dependent Lon protease